MGAHWTLLTRTLKVTRFRREGTEWREVPVKVRQVCDTARSDRAAPQLKGRLGSGPAEIPKEPIPREEKARRVP